MGKRAETPLRLCDIVEELPHDTKMFLYMENLKQGSRQKLLDTEASDEQRSGILKQFANAVVTSVVRAGEALRIIYLDETRTETLASQMASLNSGEQMQL